MNSDWVNAEWLAEHYTDENIVVPAGQMEDFRGNDFWQFDGFHAEAVTMVEQNDGYLCDMRANHFVVEIGDSEHDYDPSKGGSVYVYFLVSANHKGIRMMTLFRVAKELVTQA